MFPEFAVVAASRRVARSRLSLPGEAARPGLERPVGVRHAVRAHRSGRIDVALCGHDVTQWALFVTTPFTGRDAADCRR